MWSVAILHTCSFACQVLFVAVAASPHAFSQINFGYIAKYSDRFVVVRVMSTHAVFYTASVYGRGASSEPSQHLQDESDEPCYRCRYVDPVFGDMSELRPYVPEIMISKCLRLVIDLEISQSAA